MKLKGEIKVRRLRAKECRRLMATTRRQERGMEQILIRSSRNRRMLLEALISDSQPPELGGSTFLLFKPPNLWCFVIATLAKECTPTGTLGPSPTCLPPPWRHPHTFHRLILAFSAQQDCCALLGFHRLGRVSPGRELGKLGLTSCHCSSNP